MDRWRRGKWLRPPPPPHPPPYRKVAAPSKFDVNRFTQWSHERDGLDGQGLPPSPPPPPFTSNWEARKMGGEKIYKQCKRTRSDDGDETPVAGRIIRASHWTAMRTTPADATDRRTVARRRAASVRCASSRWPSIRPSADTNRSIVPKKLGSLSARNKPTKKRTGSKRSPDKQRRKRSNNEAANEFDPVPNNQTAMAKTCTGWTMPFTITIWETFQ